MIRLALLARDFSAFCLRMLAVLVFLFLLVGIFKYSADSYAADVPTYGRTV
ncbi:hypothetical protein OYT13_16860 [Pandoraea sp. XJJ-1]|uniref:hypothetical protein n=1 Tax=Pandoraea sp. XJJ-1 TaxID=3002643 RepID=UPI00227F54A4|nr:hypothetical protein [Pandoraea sp. XJJ-1]WAL81509.1 hypothetical protein OYT13_16860 [Pandoraea sp. XJJ-1]